MRRKKKRRKVHEGAEQTGGGEQEARRARPEGDSAPRSGCAQLLKMAPPRAEWAPPPEPEPDPSSSELELAALRNSPRTDSDRSTTPLDRCPLGPFWWRMTTSSQRRFHCCKAPERAARRERRTSPGLLWPACSRGPPPLLSRHRPWSRARGCVGSAPSARRRHVRSGAAGENWRVMRGWLPVLNGVGLPRGLPGAGLRRLGAVSKAAEQARAGARAGARVRRPPSHKGGLAAALGAKGGAAWPASSRSIRGLGLYDQHAFGIPALGEDVPGALGCQHRDGRVPARERKRAKPQAQGPQNRSPTGARTEKENRPLSVCTSPLPPAPRLASTKKQTRGAGFRRRPLASLDPACVQETAVVVALQHVRTGLATARWLAVHSSGVARGPPYRSRRRLSECHAERTRASF